MLSIGSAKSSVLGDRLGCGTGQSLASAAMHDVPVEPCHRRKRVPRDFAARVPRVPAGGPVRAADLVARSVMLPEPGRVSELVAALRPAVPPPSSRPDEGSIATAAGGNTEASPQGSSPQDSTAEAEPDHQQTDHTDEDDAPAAGEDEDATRSAAAATSSSLAHSTVSSECYLLSRCDASAAAWCCLLICTFLHSLRLGRRIIAGFALLLRSALPDHVCPLCARTPRASLWRRGLAAEP